MNWVSLLLRCTLPAAILLACSPLHAQGFGKVKKKIVLHRKLPPVTHLTGSIGVKVAAREPQNAEIAGKLADIIEAAILKNDTRLTVDKLKPDTSVTCTVISYSLPPAVTTTRMSLTEKGQRPMRYHQVNGTISVAYQAKTKAGRVIDSDNVNVRYNDEFDDAGNSSNGGVTELIKKPWEKIRGTKNKKGAEADPKTFADVSLILLTKVANQITSRLVKTDEPVEVLLARGKLDDQNKLAEAGLWSRMLEPLETMTPFSSKEDDAYRLYNIGVVYEALAYAAEDPTAARKFFDQAAINYGKAIDAKPDEKYFLEPQNRIQAAIAQYKKLGDQAASAAKPSPGGGRDAAPAPSSSAAPAGDALTNEQVIELAKAGLDQENLIATIKAAPAVKFDLSVQGQLKLVQSGIKGPVISAMRARTTPPPAKKRAPSPAPAAKK